jgi:hypothetical protein
MSGVELGLTWRLSLSPLVSLCLARTHSPSPKSPAPPPPPFPRHPAPSHSSPHAAPCLVPRTPRPCLHPRPPRQNHARPPPWVRRGEPPDPGRPWPRPCHRRHGSGVRGARAGSTRAPPVLCPLRRPGRAAGSAGRPARA